MELLGLVLGVLVVGGVIVLALRFSRLAQSDHRARVVALGAVFRETAASSGLRYLDGGTYEHPMVGSVLQFPSLRGTWGGFEMVVDVESRSGGGGPGRITHNLLRVRATPPAGCTFDEGSLRREEPRRGGLEVGIDAGRLVVIDTRSRAGRAFNVHYALPDTEQALRARLDEVVRLAVSSSLRVAGA